MRDKDIQINIYHPICLQQLPKVLHEEAIQFKKQSKVSEEWMYKHLWWLQRRLQQLRGSSEGDREVPKLVVESTTGRKLNLLSHLRRIYFEMDKASCSSRRVQQTLSLLPSLLSTNLLSSSCQSHGNPLWKSRKLGLLLSMDSATEGWNGSPN